MSGAKSEAGGARERTDPRRGSVGGGKCLLWVTVSSPAHGYLSVTPNPSWATYSPPRVGCVPEWVEGVGRGRGVAQALVQEPRCP